jgi:hypothetical protein
MPRLFTSLLVSSCLLLGSAESDAAIEHVIAISVDGLRGDMVQAFVSGNPGDFPNFIRLQNRGAYTYNARCDSTVSETVPNHLCMITGRPVNQPAGLPSTWHHGFSSNFPTTTDTVHANGNPAVPYKHSVFDVVHDRGRSTALYYGKSRLGILPLSYDSTNGASDPIVPDHGRNKISFLSYGTTTLLLSHLTARIQGTLDAFSFVHITDPDTTGHSTGWHATVNGAYYSAIKTLDSRLGAILNTLDSKPALAGKVAILITGDHGGGAGPSVTTHTDAAQFGNAVVPFFVVAPGLPGGTDLYTHLENRADPGTSLPSYTAAAQPVRNGDLANFSTALLGLPPVPGALLKPELKTPLVATRGANGTVRVSWPGYLTGWQLQYTDDLESGYWVDESQVDEGDSCVHTVIAPPKSRFFRLKRP